MVLGEVFGNGEGIPDDEIVVMEAGDLGAKLRKVSQLEFLGKGISCSVKAIAFSCINTQGRNDQEE
jgi:hypothetical protein